MRVLVTGATGFVGRYVCAAAITAGHDVRMVVRPVSSDPGSTGWRAVLAADLAVDEAYVDLRSADGLVEMLADVDVVIHLAAAKEGDFATQFAGTVIGTENLLAAMEEAGVDKLVGVSTFSVYDYLALATGELLTEESPIDETPTRRDEYAQTKLIQEKLYRRFGDNGAKSAVVILRPGMIYGRDNLWHALLGADVGPMFVKIGSGATLPMTYVENCADAIVKAAGLLGERPEDIDGQVINIVDDELPTQRDYADAITRVVHAPRSLPVPWPVVRTLARTLEIGNRKLLDGRAKFPGIVVPDRVHARFKPLTYTNAKAKRLLGWSPRFGTATAIERSAARSDPAFEPAPADG